MHRQNNCRWVIIRQSNQQPEQATDQETDQDDVQALVQPDLALVGKWRYRALLSQRWVS